MLIYEKIPPSNAIIDRNKPDHLTSGNLSIRPKKWRTIGEMGSNEISRQQ